MCGAGISTDFPALNESNQAESAAMGGGLVWLSAPPIQSSIFRRRNGDLPLARN